MTQIQKERALLSEITSSATTYWMRNGDGTVVVCASIAMKTGGEQSRAESMENRAEKVARLLGMEPRSTGSMARSDGKGRVVVVGMAEISWSKSVEDTLMDMGLVELR